MIGSCKHLVTQAPNQTNMPDEVKKALLDYEAIQLQIRELTDKLEPLKEIITPFMEENRDQKVETSSGGYFEYKERVVWKYSNEIESEEKRIKKLKAEAVASGNATKTFTKFFEYRSPKKESEDGLV